MTLFEILAASRLILILFIIQDKRHCPPKSKSKITLHLCTFLDRIVFIIKILRWREKGKRKGREEGEERQREREREVWNDEYMKKLELSSFYPMASSSRNYLTSLGLPFMTLHVLTLVV